MCSTLAKIVKKYDPIHHPKVFADRPLLMVNGAVDTLVPAECNERLQRALCKYYIHPKRLKLSIYPEVGHAVPSAMWDEVVAWLRKWLLEEGTATK